MEIYSIRRHSISSTTCLFIEIMFIITLMICFRIVYGNGSNETLVGTNSIFLSKTIDLRIQNKTLYFQVPNKQVGSISGCNVQLVAITRATLPFKLFCLYGVKWPQQKQTCHSHDNAMPLPFQLQVTEDFFKSHNFFIMEK